LTQDVNEEIGYVLALTGIGWEECVIKYYSAKAEGNIHGRKLVAMVDPKNRDPRMGKERPSPKLKPLPAKAFLAIPVAGPLNVLMRPSTAS